MSMPPGPRLPRTLQAVGWAQRTLPWLEKCRARYGNTFTLRIRHWGDWVVLADIADIKTIFTAGDKVGFAVANPLLPPVLGRRSVMLTEEPEHMVRRKIVLPAFHGEALANDSVMIREVARNEIAGAVPAPLLALYERIRAQKGGTGAAVLLRRRCTGCSLDLTAADLGTVARAPLDEVVRCVECDRILVRTAESGI